MKRSCQQHNVGLFGISPCLEASEKDQDEVEGAATEALPGSLFLLVRASQFCVVFAGQTKLRSGGLREGWLTHVGGCAPCCRPRTRPWRRRFAISLAQVVLAFRCGWSMELLTNSDELEGLLMLAGCLCADRWPNQICHEGRASGRAVGLRFCFWFRRLWPLPRTSSCKRTRRLQPKPQTDVFGKWQTHGKAPLRSAGFGPTSPKTGHR